MHQVRAVVLAHRRVAITDSTATKSVGDTLLDTVESTAADKEDIRGIDLNKLLLRVLATALRRHIDHRTLQNLEQCLLHTLARHIASD